MNAAVAIEDRELTAADRCDRCGAQAYVRAVMAGGFELLFCAHHYRKHEDKLSETTVYVQDDTGRLFDEPRKTLEQRYNGE